jgi:hypothetical protein
MFFALRIQNKPICGEIFRSKNPLTGQEKSGLYPKKTFRGRVGNERPPLEGHHIIQKERRVFILGTLLASFNLHTAKVLVCAISPDLE